MGRLRPDAVGLNFHAKSKRSVTVREAAAIARDLPEWIEPVGVFVNHSEQQIRDICEQCGIRTVQLHGDEPADLIGQLQPLNVIRAVRLESEAESLESVAACHESAAVIRALLVDAHVPGAYGGTGHTAPWNLLGRGWSSDWPPLILAGGLTADNVAAAVQQVRPWGVDVASGVEKSPGVKDLDRVARFIDAARTAAESPT